MIDPSFADITDEELSRPNGFVVPYPPTVKELEEKVADLQNKLSLKTQNWEFVRQELTTVRNQVAELENFLKDNYTDMDESHVEQIASIFGIQLEREYFVTITATFSGTVTAPIDYDMDDLENDLQATIDTHHYGNSSVYVDLSEDSMEIDWQES